MLNLESSRRQSGGREAGQMAEGQPAPGSEVPPRRSVFTPVRWGAVSAGVAVGLSVQLLMTVLGIATGLSTTQMTEGNMMGTGPLMWAGASMVIASFFGGYVAARMSGLKRKVDGVLHGAVSWAVTTILFAVLATSIGGALVGGVFSNMTQLAQAQAQAAAGEGPVAAFVRFQVGQMDPMVLERLRHHLQNGERDHAVRLLARAGPMERERAEAIVDQALVLAGSPEAASARSRDTAEQTAQGASMAAWVVFGAVALGLLLGISGGRLGVAGSRRVDWGGSAPAA